MTSKGAIFGGNYYSWTQNLVLRFRAFLPECLIRSSQTFSNLIGRDANQRLSRVHTMIGGSPASWKEETVGLAYVSSAIRSSYLSPK